MEIYTVISSVRRACLLACAMLICPAYAWAQAAPLSFREALARVFERNPDLALFAFELKAQDGRVQQAGARPHLELGLLVENALGNGVHSGVDAAETTLSLGYTLERGAAQRRFDAAAAGRDAISTELQIRRLDVAAETARRYIAVLAGQQHLTELHEARSLAEQTLAAVVTRVQAAKAPEAEEARAQAQLARASLEEEHAEHELLTTRRRLAALWGETDAAFGTLNGELSQLAGLPTYESLRARLAQNRHFERFVTEQRLREAELRLAQTRRRPPWQVSAGVRRFENTDDHAFVFGFTVPLPSPAQAQGAITTARAQLEEVDAKRAALEVQLDLELFSIYQDLNHAYTEITILRDQVLPKMRGAVEESRYAYERGRYSYMEWSAAQREYLELKSALLAAYANAHELRVEIERLTGTSLIERDLP